MGLGEAMIVVGLGFRQIASAAQLEAAIEAALHACGIDPDRLTAIAVPTAKRGAAGIDTVAHRRGVPLRLIDQGALEAADARTMTHSVRAVQRFGVRCVAEAAALAGAGPAARLLAPRIIHGPVTCALAIGSGGS
jgi:cobalt-precorrin 5A hydrolase